MSVRSPRSAAAVVLLALALPAAACGGSDEGLLSATRAERLKDDLDAIDAAVAAGRCDAVEGRLASLKREVDELPGSVDRDLRLRLREGVTNLEDQAPTDCREQEPDEPRTQPETTPETVPEETVPEETVPEETVPEETVPEETTPKTTPDDATPPDDGTTPPGQGGTPPGQDGTPPGQGGDEGGEEAPQFGVVLP